MERKFAILTDSASDLPKSYYEEHNVECIPLGFIMDGVSYGGEDGEFIEDKDFYARLRGGAMPKTFQITPEQAKMHILPHAEKGEDVLIVSFSSGLSGTYESYVSAATEVKAAYPGRKIVVVDSLCASLGQGLFVDYIVKYADGGATIEETETYALGLRTHICHYFTVEDLNHLKRGGRVSASAAFLGTLLNVKPVLHVDEAGHLIPIEKKLGRKKSITALVTHMKELQILTPTDPIFVSHSDCAEDAETLVKALKAEYGEREIYVNMIGSVIGTHSGAGTLAVFFRGLHR